MVLMHTPEKAENFYAPDFNLKGVDGQKYSLSDISDENGTLIMFICNHCPYVTGIAGRLAATAKQLQDIGVGVAAIMPNDTDSYPADSFDNMKIFAQENDFAFPYLIDETQDVARAYDAICTPDFFGFNADGQLQYRGRLDSANQNPANDDTVPELLNAMRRIAETGTGPALQTPSMGCSIKWK